MSEYVKQFYDDLRGVRGAGKFVIFLGAGACCDYGIPTMKEMAQLLGREICNEAKGGWRENGVADVLLAVLGVTKEELGKKLKKEPSELGWNIEDLLTRLFQIRSTTEPVGEFPKVESKVGNCALTQEMVSLAESKVLDFLVRCLELESQSEPSRKGGSIDYIGKFIRLMGEFTNGIWIFTTNNDLCVEAALVWLAQERKNDTKKSFRLVDGFSHGLVPTFAMENFHVDQPTGVSVVPVYLWKMHGSIDWVFTNPTKSNDGKRRNEYGDDSVVCKIVSKERWEQLVGAGALAEDISKDASKIMIFPTPGKYSETYSSPYMDLYEGFRRTLQEAEFLLAVGTSFPDKHINSAIKAFVRRDNTHLYLVDPSFTDQRLRSALGEYDTVKPVIKTGFKNFVESLERLEKEEETGASGNTETREDKNE